MPGSLILPAPSMVLVETRWAVATSRLVERPRMRPSQATYPPSSVAPSRSHARNARFKRTGVHILVPSAYRARERTTSARSPVACTYTQILVHSAFKIGCRQLFVRVLVWSCTGRVLVRVGLSFKSR
eukprot:scaffold421463_cov38-Prasinocladus_malaysianus.AAC.1